MKSIRDKYVTEAFADNTYLFVGMKYTGVIQLML